MDRYAFVLERLREDDYRRLRTFASGHRARFTTWLVVVVGRLCIDYHRRRYGAGTNPEGEGKVDWRVDLRRRLVDHVYTGLDPQLLKDQRQESPDLPVRREQLGLALREAFDALDAQDRLFLRLRYFDDLTAREIAEAMAFPTQFHVYRRLNRLLERLRRDLEALGIGDPEP